MRSVCVFVGIATNGTKKHPMVIEEGERPIVQRSQVLKRRAGGQHMRVHNSE